MGKAEKIKKKDDAELLKCPFSAIKDNCVTVLCMSWENGFSGDGTMGYCMLIQSE